MRRGPVIVLLLALVLSGVAAGSVAVAQPRVPPTLQALRSPFPSGVIDTQPDSGTAADRDAVRAAVIGALDDESRVFSVTAAQHGMPRARLLASLTSKDAERARLALLERTRTPALARQMADAFDWTAHHGLGRHAQGEPGLFVGGRFHVDGWQGVQIAGDTARAVVMGETRGHDWRGRDRHDPWAQFKLLLRRSPSAPHGWRLVRTQAATAVD